MDLNAFYKIECGMYIVSTALEGKLNGQIVNAVVQVTAEPPQIAVSLNKQNLTCQMCAKSGVFSVSVLERDTPLTFIGRWGFKSGRDLDKFAGVEHRLGTTGAPIVLDHALAYFEARVAGTIDAGTHLVLVGKVVEAELLRDEEPMDYMYYRTVKKGLTSRFAASYQAKPGAEGAGRGAHPEDLSAIAAWSSLPRRVSPAFGGAGREAQGAGAAAGVPVSAPGPAVPSGPPKPAEPGALPPLAVPARYRCSVCGYIYDPARADPDGGRMPGTAFEELPPGWKCPVCGAGKERFSALPP